MKVGETVCIRFLDDDGYEILCDREFDTMKEARAFFQAIKDDRQYFVERAECGSFPVLVHTIQLVKNGEIILDHFPEFA